MRVFGFLVFLLSFIAFSVSQSVQADNYNETLITLTEMNRIQPLQNPAYEPSQDVLDRHVIDRKNKVIGEVQDVVLNKNGSVYSLEFVFDRLGLRQPVYMDFNNNRMRAVSNGYALNFSDDQIEELYPSMLADIETAAGDGEKTISVKRIRGANVVAKDGRNLGQVKDVLFNTEGRRAEALLLTMLIGTLRGQTVAVPYTMADIEPATGDTVQARIENTDADAVIDYAKKK